LTPEANKEYLNPHKYNPNITTLITNIKTIFHWPKKKGGGGK